MLPGEPRAWLGSAGSGNLRKVNGSEGVTFLKKSNRSEGVTFCKIWHLRHSVYPETSVNGPREVPGTYGKFFTFSKKVTPSDPFTFRKILNPFGFSFRKEPLRVQLPKGTT